MRGKRGAARLIWWAILVAGFVISRVFILYSPALYHGMPSRVQPDLEEFFIGNIAIEAIRGPIEPIFNIKDRAYEGYMVINGILAVPFFLMLGTSYAALKMTALVFSVGTLVALAIFAKREFGTYVSCIVSLLFFFPPPGVIRFSLWAIGHYPQSQLITVLILLCVFPIFFPSNPENPPSRIRLALSGLLCGLGIYFHPFLIVTVAYCALVAIIFRRDIFTPKRLAIVLASFIVGLGVFNIPFLFTLYDQVFFPGKTGFWTVQNLHDASLRVKILFTRFLWQFWHYSDVSARFGPLFGKTFYGLIVLVYLVLWFLAGRDDNFFQRNRRRDKTVALLLFALVFVSFYGGAHLVQATNPASMRYLNALVPFIYLYFGILFSWLIEGALPRIFRGLGITIIALIVAVDAVGLAGLVGPLGEGEWRMKAVWMKGLGEVIGKIYVGKDHNPILWKIRERRGEEDARELMQGFFDTQINELGRRDNSVETAIVYMEGIDPAFRTESCLAFGRFLASRELKEPQKKIGEAVPKQLPPELSGCVARGMGSWMGWHIVARYPDKWPERLQKFEEIASQFEPEHRRELYFGLGSVLVWKYDLRTFERDGRDEERFQALAQFIPEDVKLSFLNGKEVDLYYRFGEW